MAGPSSVHGRLLIPVAPSNDWAVALSVKVVETWSPCWVAWRCPAWLAELDCPLMNSTQSALGLRAWYGLFARIAYQATVDAVAWMVFCALFVVRFAGFVAQFVLERYRHAAIGLLEVLPPLFVPIGILLVRQRNPRQPVVG